MKIEVNILYILDNGLDLCHRFDQGSRFWLLAADISDNPGSTTYAFYVWSLSPPAAGWLLFRHWMLLDPTPLVNNPGIVSGLHPK